MLEIKKVQMLDLRLEYEHMKADIDGAVRACLEHQKWILGPEVKELETNIAAYLGVEHCVGASSGTDALVLALRALAIKLRGREYFERKDLVITTPFTFTATGDSILRSGATPLFVDIDPATYNMDPALVEECAKKHGDNVVGIMPVHLYGQTCDMDGIMDIALRRRLFVVEDVAQAFGAAWKGVKAGAIGTLGCFSFFPSKNLGCFGDGGMVSTSDPELADTVRMLLKHGGRDKYNVDHIGYNARLDTLQAAVLLAKLKHVDGFNSRRRRLASAYDAALGGLKNVSVPACRPESYHVYHQYTIRLNDGDRDALQRHLAGQGVDSMLYYPFPLHKMKVFGGGNSMAFGGLSNAEESCRRVLSLPVEPLQSEEATARVASAVKGFFL